MKTFALQYNNADEYSAILSHGTPSQSVIYGETGEVATIKGHLLPAIFFLDFTPKTIIAEYHG